MADRGYVRISLDTERSGSIAKQREQIERHGGDVEFYSDESISGSKIPFSERPAGARLLADLRSGDRVLITKIDRAARNVADLLNLAERIDNAGAALVFVEQNIDTSGPMGKFFLTVIGAIAELEAAIIGERRRETLASFREQGRHGSGSAPFGFHSVENPDGRGLVIRPHPIYGPLVRDAVLSVAGGGSQKAARETLRDQIVALPPLDDEDKEHPVPLSQSGFQHLLVNPRLAGMTPRHEYDTIENEDGTTTERLRIDVHSKDGVPLIDSDAALLSMAEWVALRDTMESGKGKGWSTAPGYGAALTCGECGERLYYAAPSQTRVKALYSCARKKHAPGSKAASITAAIADKFLEDTYLSSPLAGTLFTEIRMVEDSATRLEAIAVARTRLEVAQRALSVADEEDEEAAFAAVRLAKAAIREAEEMPSNRRYVAVETGETVADRWSGASFAERCEMLLRVGTWTVKPGHLPVDKKIEVGPSKDVEDAQ